MKTLTVPELEKICKAVAKTQSNLTHGFLKPWKINSLVFQVNQLIEYKNELTTEESYYFFQNAMEMEGFVPQGIKTIHDLVMNHFKS